VLQKRYAGYFSPHVQRRINAQHAEKKAFEKAMSSAKTKKYTTPIKTPIYE
jgi:hypothetical protein